MAWLKGLSPKENRDVPPLDYGLVRRLKRERPDLTIVINGGVASLDEAAAHLDHVEAQLGSSEAAKRCIWCSVCATKPTALA